MFRITVEDMTTGEKTKMECTSYAIGAIDRNDLLMHVYGSDPDISYISDAIKAQVKFN